MGKWYICKLSNWEVSGMECNIKDRWLKTIERKKRDNTVMSYRKNIDHLYSYFNQKFNIDNEIEMIKRINNDDMEDFIYEMEEEYTKSTINNRIATYNLFFKYCIKGKGIITHNPMGMIKQYSPKEVADDCKEKYIPTLKEVRDLIEVCKIKSKGARCFNLLSRRNASMLAILSSTGLRPIELIKAKFENLEKLDGSYILTIPKENCKTHISRRVPITGLALKYFEEYLSERSNTKYNELKGYIFISSRGNRINGKNLNEIIKKNVLLANIKIPEDKQFSIYCLRHFTSCILVEKKESEYMINNLLGWSNKNNSMLNRYSNHIEFYDKEKIRMCSYL